MPYIAKTIQSNDKMMRSAYLGVLRKLDSIHKPVDKTTNNNCDRNDIIKPRVGRVCGRSGRVGSFLRMNGILVVTRTVSRAVRLTASCWPVYHRVASSRELTARHTSTTAVDGSDSAPPPRLTFITDDRLIPRPTAQRRAYLAAITADSVHKAETRKMLMAFY